MLSGATLLLLQIVFLMMIKIYTKTALIVVFCHIILRHACGSGGTSGQKDSCFEVPVSSGNTPTLKGRSEAERPMLQRPVAFDSSSSDDDVLLDIKSLKMMPRDVSSDSNTSFKMKAQKK
nr:increased DNA methylation 1-like [Ipomoea batatas]